MCERTNALTLKCEQILNDSWGKADGNLKDFERISKHGIKSESDECFAKVAAALVVQQILHNHAQNKLVGLSSDGVDEVEEEIV